MKISIITATYNSAATVRNTLESISGQGHPDIEHIIMDGRSTDDTLAIAAGFPHIAKIVSEKDQGIYDAMNKGILAATGEVVGILNSDDIYADASVLSLIAETFSDPAVMTDKEVQHRELFTGDAALHRQLHEMQPGCLR